MKVVILDDGNRGNLNQAVGVAERIPEAEIEVIRVPPSSWWRQAILLMVANLAPLLPLFKIRLFVRYLAQIKFEPRFPKPAAVLSAGAKLAPVNLLLSRYLLARSIQILYPDLLKTRLFDLLILPEHDLLRHPGVKKAHNLLLIKGATNRIRPLPRRKTKDLLRNLPPFRKDFQAPLPFPSGAANGDEKEENITLAVLIGGNDKNYRISERWARQLSLALDEVSQALHAKVCLTTSRRTPKNVEEIFQRILGYDRKRFSLLLYWKTFANPVAEFLAKGDLVLTTEDSINMVSEAASSGKPAIVLRVERKRKLLVFDVALKNLADQGYIKLWTLEDIDRENIISALGQSNWRVLAETERAARKVYEVVHREKILIVAPSCLGDNLILSPAYRTIRENFPSASIDVITDKRASGYFDGHPYFRKIFYYDKGACREKKRRFLAKIRQEPYRIVFDFRNSLFGIKSQARYRVTFYFLALGRNKDEHETDRWLRLLAHYLPLPAERSFFFPLREADLLWVEERLIHLGLTKKRFVVVNPGGRWEKKRWKPDNFAKLISLLWQDYHLPVVIVGDKDEVGIAAKIYSFLPPQKKLSVFNLAGQTSLGQLAALLFRAALLVSNDTGTLHLASAVKCPVVVLFGPGDWRRYGPYQTPYRIVSSGLPCSPCGKTDCPNNFICWEKITPQRVLAEISALLK